MSHAAISKVLNSDWGSVRLCLVSWADLTPHMPVVHVSIQLWTSHQWVAALQNPNQTTMCTRAKMIPKATLSHFRSAPLAAKEPPAYSIKHIFSTIYLFYTVSQPAWSHFSFIATFPFHLIWSNTWIVAQHLSAPLLAPNRVLARRWIRWVGTARPTPGVLF